MAPAEHVADEAGSAPDASSPPPPHAASDVASQEAVTPEVVSPSTGEISVEAPSPDGSEPVRSWSDVDDDLAGTVALKFYSEKVPGEGEDAEPLLLATEDFVYLAVFDGLGGSGSQRYVSSDGSEEVRKGAYLASRKARDVLASVLPDLPPGSGGPAAAVPALNVVLLKGLENLGVSYQTTSRVLSQHKHEFPTTLALAAIGREKDGRRQVQVVWCGDSRAYVLLPEEGLQQLSRDHIGALDDSDPGLGGDAPMTRRLSPDGVDLETYETDVPAEAVFITASDGCFGYWPSAVHFEATVLSTLLAATTWREWSETLLEKILQVSGDDATIAIVVASCPDLGTLQGRFTDRGQFITQQLSAIDSSNPDHVSRLWGDYEPGYHARQAPPAAAPSDADPPARSEGDDPAVEAAGEQRVAASSIEEVGLTPSSEPTPPTSAAGAEILAAESPGDSASANTPIDPTLADGIGTQREACTDGEVLRR